MAQDALPTLKFLKNLLKISVDLRRYGVRTKFARVRHFSKMRYRFAT